MKKLLVFVFGLLLFFSGCSVPDAAVDEPKLSVDDFVFLGHQFGDSPDEVFGDDPRIPDIEDRAQYDPYNEGALEPAKVFGYELFPYYTFVQGELVGIYCIETDIKNEYDVTMYEKIREETEQYGEPDSVKHVSDSVHQLMWDEDGYSIEVETGEYYLSVSIWIDDPFEPLGIE